MYPSPPQQLSELSAKLKYATPAQQLAEMTLKEKQVEKQVELSALSLPSELHKQMKSLMLYSPMPTTDGEEEMSVTRKSELVHGSVCCKPCNRSKPAAPQTLTPAK